MSLNQKMKILQSRIKKLKRAAVAISGGVDSSLLAKVSHDSLRKDAIAIFVKSDFISAKEESDAKKIAERIGIKLYTIRTGLGNPRFQKNTPKRCYYCKKEIFKKIKSFSRSLGIKNIIEGTNADDSCDYRPGQFALKELKIISPLKEAGLTKNEIRILSKKLGLETWDKPNNACLSTRIPYGTKITKEILRKIEKAEEFLSRIGIRQSRVRYFGKTAKIEVLKQDMARILKNSGEISKEFRKIGFTYITLDIEGYRTGAMNESIRAKKIP